jgi:hypothetical protein
MAKIARRTSDRFEIEQDGQTSLILPTELMAKDGSHFFTLKWRSRCAVGALQKISLKWHSNMQRKIT